MSEDKQAPLHWEWPADDRRPINLSAYDLTAYRKQGLSEIKAARLLPEDTPEYWRNRHRYPIHYLVKYVRDALAERMYYRLARTLQLPYQHVFWGTFSGNENLIAVAIRFESEAFFPASIDEPAGTVMYRRRRVSVFNAWDRVRHRVLHHFCGTHDNVQVMVREHILFGIDAADCRPLAQDEAFWHWFVNLHRENEPESIPVLLDMMQRIAAQITIPDLIDKELRSSPYPIVRDQGTLLYSPANLHATRQSLTKALATLT